MQEIEEKTPRETELIKTLAEIEDLAEKKTKIYSRLLIEQTLATEMESLSARHTARRERLEKLAFGKAKKTDKGQDVSKTNGENVQK
ncbi:MAG: hypothetical protein IJ373_01185 [Clostridia bacterium]|nr:hypothetical protein [Clostridia bacterium]MBQ8446509.1 hypothetical protein [Clostridia bacterium]